MTSGNEPRRPSLGGGRPAQDRELRAQGRQTVHNLLEAGLAEFDEKGFQAVSYTHLTLPTTPYV